jgi:GT2 family glycosyltransferase
METSPVVGDGDTSAGRPEPPAAPVVSICILTYQARDYLRQCLQSLAENTTLQYEVIVVDNGSQDQVAEMLELEFPGVRLIQNQINEGYTKPMNLAMSLGAGQYLCQLNPDTLALPAAIDRLVDFMELHPEAGICGPKVLNRDLSLQKPCRRGESRPWAVISYFTGLARLFPHSPLFGQYLMSFMDEDQTHPVAGVAGSCMLIRKEVVEQIGYMDEQFFAYQEDADYCLRAHQAGWEVYYMPEAQIIHFGGMGGSRVEPYRSIYEWHRSYYLFYKKHYAREYFFLFNFIYYFLMFIKLSLALLVNFLRKDKFAGSRKP